MVEGTWHDDVLVGAIHRSHASTPIRGSRTSISHPFPMILAIALLTLLLSSILLHLHLKCYNELQAYSFSLALPKKRIEAVFVKILSMQSAQLLKFIVIQCCRN